MKLLATVQNAKAEFISVVENMKSELLSDVLEAHKKEFDSIKKDVVESLPSVAVIKAPQTTNAVSMCKNGSSHMSHRDEILAVGIAEARVLTKQNEAKLKWTPGEGKSYKKKNSVTDRREYVKETDSVKSHQQPRVQENTVRRRLFISWPGREKT